MIDREEAAAKAAKEKERREEDRRQELEDLHAVLKTGAGRRFIWRQLEKGRPLASAYTGNSNTYFNEGKQEAAKELFSDILMYFPKSYILMQNEAKRRQAEEENRNG